MNMNTFLRSAEIAFFNSEYMDALDDEYFALVKRGDFSEEERAYELAKSAVDTDATREEANLISELEKTYFEKKLYACKYGFYAGLFCGFHYAFTYTKRRSDLDDIFEKDMFEIPGMKRHREYFAHTSRGLEISSMLEASMSAALYSHVTSIECAWDQRIYFCAHQSFYIGYKTALACLDRVKPGMSVDMMADTLLLEYELGMIGSYEQWQRISNGQHRTEGT